MSIVPIGAGSQVFPGLGPRSFGSYLAAVGLVRVLAEQTDPGLAAWWVGDALRLVTRVDDVATWLVEEYRPSPIISPWNGGSGFGVKDGTSREALESIAACEADRLADLVSAIGFATVVTARSQDRGWDKARLVSELRNRCPEGMLNWLDACIVLRDQGAAFPPLLGTGGNDGRLDFSTNFHQRLHDVLPELGAPVGRSRAWAGDLLSGSEKTQLVRGAVGQFAPGAAGGRNSSPYGAAESQVNPWQFVLLLEGALCFASSVARRQGTQQSKAAMPFCVFPSVDGPRPGADGEDSRGEIWTPVWNHPLTAAEIAHLFVESRASWQGKVASQASQMYAALRSFGVARGIDSFVRYGLHKRNGLAFTAVRLDEVEVRADRAIELSTEPQRVSESFGRVHSSAVTQAKRRLDRHHMNFVRTVAAEPLRDLLVEQTLADVAVLRSTNAQSDLGRRLALPRADAYVGFLANGLRAQAEFRVAVTLASAGWLMNTTQRGTIRDLLVGGMPIPRTWHTTWVQPKVRGLGMRPLPALLAECVVWRSRQSEGTGKVERGFVPFPDGGVQAPWSDLHAWVQGQLDDDEVAASFLACLALDWRHARSPWPVGVPRPSPVVPIPELAVLQAFASGVLTVGGWRESVQRSQRTRPVEAIRYGLARDWPTRFLAEQQELTVTRRGPTAHGQTVIGEATALLGRLGWQLARPDSSELERPRLIAALVASSTTHPLRRIGADPPGQEPEAPDTRAAYVHTVRIPAVEGEKE